MFSGYLRALHKRTNHQLKSMLHTNLFENIGEVFVLNTHLSSI